MTRKAVSNIDESEGTCEISGKAEVPAVADVRAMPWLDSVRRNHHLAQISHFSRRRRLEGNSEKVKFLKILCEK